MKLILFFFESLKQNMMKLYKNRLNLIQKKASLKREISVSTVFFLMSLAIHGLSFTVDGITYNQYGNISNNVVEVMSGCMETVTIPETVVYNSNTYYVNRIASDAFLSCNNLVNLNLPNSLLTIESHAFEACDNLVNITIPDSVILIEYQAFAYCTSLTNITFSDSPISFGSSIFRGCTGLTSVSLPNTFTSIPSAFFYDCTSLSSVTLPETITSINPSAFRNCSSLTSIVIPESVMNIGLSTFSGCSSLISINIPDGVATIEDGLFFGCSSLLSISLPETITSIGNSAFRGNQALTSINIPESVNSIGTSAFYFCTSLANIAIPENVTIINEYTFFRCSSIDQFNIPETVTAISNNAFGQCYGLTDFNVNWDSPISISSNVFFQTAIENITLNVPLGLVSTYEAASVWMDFNPITDATLNTSEVASLNNVNLFPNPATDYISITNLNTQDNYTIYDVLGKKVNSGQLLIDSKISVAQLEKGIYFLKLENYKTLRFLKN